MGRRRKIPDGAREIDGFLVYGNMTDEEFRMRIAESKRHRAYEESLSPEVRSRVHEFVLSWTRHPWNEWGPTYAEYGNKRLPEYVKFIESLTTDGLEIGDLDLLDYYIDQQICDLKCNTGAFGDD